MFYFIDFEQSSSREAIRYKISNEQRNDSIEKNFKVDFLKIFQSRFWNHIGFFDFKKNFNQQYKLTKPLQNFLEFPNLNSRNWENYANLLVVLKQILKNK